MFNKLVDSFHYTNKKIDRQSWKRLLGDSVISEFYERDKITSKHQEIVFKFVAYMVENQENIFLQSKKSKKFEMIVKKLLGFYSSFFKYYRYGNEVLIRQVSKELEKRNHALKTDSHFETRENKKVNIKTDLVVSQKKIDELIATICIYRLVMKSILEDRKITPQEETNSIFGSIQPRQRISLIPRQRRAGLF